MLNFFIADLASFAQLFVKKKLFRSGQVTKYDITKETTFGKISAKS